MTILYESVVSDSVAAFAIVAMGIVAILIIGFVIYKLIDERDISWLILLLFVLIPVAIIISAANNMDYKIVKATLDKNVSYIEINDKYELLSQEGDIYTFKVKGESDELVQKEEK